MWAIEKQKGQAYQYQIFFKLILIRKRIAG